MARKSYDRMYREYDVKEYDNKRDKKIEEAKKETKIPETIVEDVKEEVKKLHTGTVCGGANLNVRKNPNGDIITSIKDGSSVTIVDEQSTDDWYKIESPINGYVMKQFIKD